MSLMKNIEKEIVESLKRIDLLKHENIQETLETPPEPSFGDLASNISFSLSKKLKKSPLEIAEQISSKIKIPKDSVIKKVEAKAGYINFSFDYEKITEDLLKTILKEKEKYGSSNIGNKKRVMVEFSQPNPVHPMHIGHARSTFMGDSVSNILEYTGFKTIRTNYMNNTGLQVAKLVASYMLWGKNKKPDEKPDSWLWKYYVKFHEEVEKNPELEEKAREILRKYENEKDKRTIELWDRIVKWCVNGFEQTYRRARVKFDVYFYENDFRDAGKKIVENALKKGFVFRGPEGTLVANLEKYGLPSFVVLRSDGTGLYQTSDLGMTVHKFEKYKLDKSIWVVASAQNLYFKQIFKTLEVMGYPWTDRCHHLAFDLVKLPEGKMSSRKGRAVMLDETIDKLTKMELEEVEKKNPKLSKEEKQEIAEKIGIGALRYAILRIEPDKTITFDWKRMLSFEGDTGPYLQYAHVRADKILQKAGKWKEYFKVERLTKQEKNLIKKLMEFPEIVGKASKDLRPHYICNYAHELSDTFSSFYHSCPVIQSKGDLRNFRLTLVRSFKITLKNCLNLLGIETPGAM